MNLKRFEELRDLISELDDSEFDMRDVHRCLTYYATLLSKFWVWYCTLRIMWRAMTFDVRYLASSIRMDATMKILGINSHEFYYLYSGKFTNEKCRATRRQVLEYLDKVIKYERVFVAV